MAPLIGRWRISKLVYYLLYSEGARRLLEDIVNGRLDNSGPLREGRRLGLRLIKDEWSAGFIEGRQLLDPIRNQYSWVLTHVALMKEAVLDFAQRHQLPSPSWWEGSAGTSALLPKNATSNMEVNVAAAASAPRGKQPRITEYLRQHFPAGVPGPGVCPRHRLRADLLKWDPSLEPLDEATLKRGIDNYNSSLTGQNIDPK
jgi:hypothetical protein